MTKRRSFKRVTGKRRYRKIFLIATEGAVTEPQYFSLFNDDEHTVHVKCVPKKNRSAPKQVLSALEAELKKMALQKTDEAWLVVDKDNWPDSHIEALWNWSNEKKNHGFALSNPNFEYWLLLHFEPGSGVSSAEECLQRLRKHINNYDKSISVRLFSKEKVLYAIENAKNRDHASNNKWPKSVGTTVYQLVQNIMGSKNE